MSKKSIEDYKSERERIERYRDHYFGKLNRQKSDHERIRREQGMGLKDRSMISSEEIYEELCKKIENLDFMPGTSISENNLCQEYRTTRHIIRGAITKLKEEGLVEVYPQRGTFVSLIDMDYVSDTLYIREAIEQEVVVEIAESENIRKVVKLLKKNLQEQEQCLKKYAKVSPDDEDGRNEYCKKFLQLDQVFHQIIFDGIGRGRINEMLDKIYVHYRRWRNLELRSTMRLSELYEQHKELVECINVGDRNKIREVLHEHINTVRLAREVSEREENEYFYR